MILSCEGGVVLRTARVYCVIGVPHVCSGARVKSAADCVINQRGELLFWAFLFLV